MRLKSRTNEGTGHGGKKVFYRSAQLCVEPGTAESCECREQNRTSKATLRTLGNPVQHLGKIPQNNL